MNYRTATLIVFVLALVFVAFVAAQTSSTGSSAAPQASQNASESNISHAQATHATHQMHLPPNFSADEAYKQNCTRCHSEVPPVNARRTKTIVRHMRVRANLTADEAQAILQYLTQ